MSVNNSIQISRTERFHLKKKKNRGRRTHWTSRSKPSFNFFPSSSSIRFRSSWKENQLERACTFHDGRLSPLHSSAPPPPLPRANRETLKNRESINIISSCLTRPVSSFSSLLLFPPPTLLSHWIHFFIAFLQTGVASGNTEERNGLRGKTEKLG